MYFHIKNKTGQKYFCQVNWFVVNLHKKTPEGVIFKNLLGFNTPRNKRQRLRFQRRHRRTAVSASGSRYRSWLCSALLRLAINANASASNAVTVVPPFQRRALAIARGSARLVPSKVVCCKFTYKKNNTRRCYFFIWYPQANSNCCLHRERVLS